MNLNFLKKINYYRLILVIISVCIIILSGYFSQNSAFFYDEYDFGVAPYPSDSILKCMFNYAFTQHNGGYTTLIMLKALNFKLPVFLHLHPGDFLGFWNGIIKGIFGVFIILSVSKYINIFVKSKTLYLSAFFYFAFLYFYSGLYWESFFLRNISFYRYLFSFLFFSVFWYFIYKSIICKKTKINITNLVFMCLCGFIIGGNLETIAFSSVLLSLFLVFYNLIQKYFFGAVKNKYNLNLNFYLPVLFLFITSFILISSHGFKNIAEDRGLSDLAGSMHNFLYNINEFSILFFKYCFSDYLFYWIVFICLLIFSLYHAQKRNELYKIIFPVLMQISVLIITFSLIFCGKTNENYFWIESPRVINIFFWQLHITLFILISYSLKFFRNKRFILFLILLIIFLPLCIKFMTENIPSFFMRNEQFINYKKTNYITEKIMRFYYLKEQVPLLPEKYIGDDISFPHWMHNFSDGADCSSLSDTFSTIYYRYIYKSNIGTKIPFCIDNNAVNKFKKNGGVIKDYELENIKFSRLFDEDFVLNKKQ